MSGKKKSSKIHMSVEKFIKEHTNQKWAYILVDFYWENKRWKTKSTKYQDGSVWRNNDPKWKSNKLLKKYSHDKRPDLYKYYAKKENPENLDAYTAIHFCYSTDRNFPVEDIDDKDEAEFLEGSVQDRLVKECYSYKSRGRRFPHFINFNLSDEKNILNGKGKIETKNKYDKTYGDLLVGGNAVWVRVGEQLIIPKNFKKVTIDVSELHHMLQTITKLSKKPTDKGANPNPEDWPYEKLDDLLTIVPDKMFCGKYADWCKMAFLLNNMERNGLNYSVLPLWKKHSSRTAEYKNNMMEIVEKWVEITTPPRENNIGEASLCFWAKQHNPTAFDEWCEKYSCYDPKTLKKKLKKKNKERKEKKKEERKQQIQKQLEDVTKDIDDELFNQYFKVGMDNSDVIDTSLIEWFVSEAKSSIKITALSHIYGYYYEEKTGLWNILDGELTLNSLLIQTYQPKLYERFTPHMKKLCSVYEKTDKEYHALIKKLDNILKTNFLSKDMRQCIAFGLLDKSFEEKIDVNRHLLAVKNGVVDLRTEKLRERTKEDLLSYCLNIDYNPKAKNTEWTKFIKSIMCNDEDMLKYLQVVLGYGITGEIREQLCFFMEGSGSNGKGILMQTMEEIIGDYFCITSMNVLTSDGREEDKFKAKLRGVRQSWIDDPKTDKLTARFKNMTGGGTIEARPLYHEAIKFLPTNKFFINVNQMPESEADVAIYRRIIIISFLCKYVDNFNDPNFPESDFCKLKDRDIKEKLLREKEGILYWLIEGAHKYYTNGKLNHPQSVLNRVEEYKESSDWTYLFICGARNVKKLLKKNNELRKRKDTHDKSKFLPEEKIMTTDEIIETLKFSGYTQTPTSRNIKKILTSYGCKYTKKAKGNKRGYKYIMDNPAYTHVDSSDDEDDLLTKNINN